MRDVVKTNVKENKTASEDEDVDVIYHFIFFS